MLSAKQQQRSRPPNQAGFTIIESLMAIIVVSILMIAIAPVIVLSVATRVQARRVEQAAQAGRSYIDALRAETIAAPPINNVPLPNQSNPKWKTILRNNLVAELEGISAPNPNLNCNPATSYFPYCSDPSTSSPYILYCVDGDGDGECTNDSLKDMIVQAFGVNTAPAGLNNQQKAAQGYRLGIRVYRADAFTPGRILEKSQGERESTFTGGTGLKDKQGPLLEITTEIVTDGTSYNDFCSRLGCN